MFRNQRRKSSRSRKIANDKVSSDRIATLQSEYFRKPYRDMPIVLHCYFCGDLARFSASRFLQLIVVPSCTYNHWLWSLVYNVTNGNEFTSSRSIVNRVESRPHTLHVRRHCFRYRPQRWTTRAFGRRTTANIARTCARRTQRATGVFAWTTVAAAAATTTTRSGSSTSRTTCWTAPSARSDTCRWPRGVCQHRSTRTFWTSWPALRSTSTRELTTYTTTTWWQNKFGMWSLSVLYRWSNVISCRRLKYLISPYFLMRERTKF